MKQNKTITLNLKHTKHSPYFQGEWGEREENIRVGGGSASVTPGTLILKNKSNPTYYLALT